MADLAASYCERCGTRYSFAPSPSGGSSLRDAKVVAKGLKYFVMNNSASIGEAMEIARNDIHSDESSRAAEQFHKTFNFCMTCRQYACDSCWNTKQGACLTCAPEAAFEAVEPADRLIVRTPVSRLEPAATAPTLRESLGAPRPETMPWPAQDLPVATASADTDAATRSAVAAAAAVRQAGWSLWPAQDDHDPSLTLTAEELALVEGGLDRMTRCLPAEVVEVAEVAEVAETSSPVDDLPTNTVPAQDGQHIQADFGTRDANLTVPWPYATPWSVRPIQSPALQADSIVNEPSSSVDPETQLSAAAYRAEWSVPAERQALPSSQTEPSPSTDGPGRSESQDETSWPIAADLAADRNWAAEAATLADAEAAAVQQPLFGALPASTGRWAAAPNGSEIDSRRPKGDMPASWQPLGASWPTPEAAGGPWPGPDASDVPAAVVAAQQAARGNGTAIWADSAQAVLSRGNVRACHHCALPVSTHARFCRRCGTQQA